MSEPATNTAAHASAPLTRETLLTDIAEVLDEDPGNIGWDDDLLDVGLDSIRLMHLTVRWRAAGVDIALLDLATETTPRAWWDLIQAADGHRQEATTPPTP
ncbi:MULTISPECIES: phosphopantetheine-binding protein [unclassified Streptomyces]|uniref:phosphopantetheine-binding protein n=1 Tax=unclassified Streptomyces TaxID=2593676 RepID=UPI0037FC4D6B